jgi:dGTPase
MLASYATDPQHSKGRLYSETPTPYRNEFERDRDRIIHSNAFKRLQYKTQVFINHEGDHYRNRLTHSLEVSTVARSIARTLRLSEHLAESVALAHDLGHTPFGHAGEEALNACMENFGGFSHNAHSLKILTKIEHKYASYEGLNLTWEVLEGIVKHNGPIKTNTPKFITDFNVEYDLDLKKYSSAEAQLASLSDDITYICHDIEDGFGADILHIHDLEEREILKKYIAEVRAKFPNIEQSSLIYETVRKLIHYLIKDLLDQTNQNLENYKIKTPEDIRNLSTQIVSFSASVDQEIIEIKRILYKKVYKHPRVEEVTDKCQIIVKGLFKLYMADESLLPAEWIESIANAYDQKSRAILIADYIAGMTDRFAIQEYQTHYNLHFNKI